MTTVHLKQLFNRSRLPGSWPLLLVLLIYSPIGLVLLLIRSFLAAQVLLAATLLSHCTAVRRLVLRVMSVVLGVVVRQEGSCSPSAQLLLANHITALDALAAHLLTGCTAVWSPDIPSVVNMILGFQKKEFNNSLPPLTKEPLLLFPEGTTTNGKKGILKLSLPSPTSPLMAQPMALDVWSPPIASLNSSTIHSGFWADMVAIFFTPVTIFTFRFLPPLQLEMKGEDEGLLAPQIQRSLADALHIQPTTYTAHDKRELVKLLRPPVSSVPHAQVQPVRPLTNQPISLKTETLSKSDDKQQEVRQRVQFPTSMKQTPFGRTAHERMKSFEERKSEMLETARKCYIEKQKC